MFQDEALLAFSEYFKEYQDALYYQLLAQKRLKNYFDYIISAEGVHLEHSPIYHQIIAQSVLNYYKYFNNVGNTTISNYLLNKFNSMFNFSTFIIKPDGFFPAIGDTQYNLKPDTNIWKSNEWYQFAASAGKKENLTQKQTWYLKNQDMQSSEILGIKVLIRHMFFLLLLIILDIINIQMI